MADIVTYIVKVGEFYVETFRDQNPSIRLGDSRDDAYEFDRGDTAGRRDRARSLAKRLNGKAIRVETSLTKTETEDTE